MIKLQYCNDQFESIRCHGIYDELVSFRRHCFIRLPPVVVDAVVVDAVVSFQFCYLLLTRAKEMFVTCLFIAANYSNVNSRSEKGYNN
jgi:hypothetical protein